MTVYTSGYTKNEIDKGVGLGLASPLNIYNSLRLAFGVMKGGYTITETTNAEWAYVLVDSADKVLAGVRKDDSLFVAEL